MAVHSVRGHWRKTQNGYSWVSPHFRDREEGFQVGNDSPTWIIWEFSSEQHFKLALLLIDDNEDLVSELKYYRSLSYDECHKLYEQLPEWEKLGFNSESHYELAIRLSEEQQKDVYDYSSWSESECRNKLALIEQSKPLWSRLGFTSEKHYSLSNILVSLDGGRIEQYKSFTEEQCSQLIWDKTPVWKRQKFSSNEHYELARTLSKRNGFAMSTYRVLSVAECRAALSVEKPKSTNSIRRSRKSVNNKPKETSLPERHKNNINVAKSSVCSQRAPLKPLPKVRNDYVNMPDRPEDKKDTNLYLWGFLIFIIIPFILFFLADAN